jgi:hypothetical protein
MAGYARPRQDTNPPLKWDDLVLCDLEGKEITWLPKAEWAHSYFFCIDTGLYVLSDDEDVAFTAHSIDLEFRDEVPNDNH